MRRRLRRSIRSRLRRSQPPRNDLFRRPDIAGEPAREPDIQVSSLGIVRSAADCNPVSGLYSAFFSISGLFGLTAAGDGVFRIDAPQPDGGDVYRRVYRAGAGFAVEESAGDIWDREDVGGLLRRVRGAAVRCGPFVYPAVAGIFL